MISQESLRNIELRKQSENFARHRAEMRFEEDQQRRYKNRALLYTAIIIASSIYPLSVVMEKLTMFEVVAQSGPILAKSELSKDELKTIKANVERKK